MGRRFMGTSGLAVVTLVSGFVLAVGSAAWAQSGDSGSSSSSGSSSTASSGQSDLGGWTLNSTAAGVSVWYEQPNLPIPATPTLEFDLGYSQASFNAGPVGNANGAVLWPGAVVAGGGSELPLLLDPYLEQYAPSLAPALEPLVPTSVDYPAETTSAYPQGPDSATNDDGTVAMNSSADENSSQANSSLGIVGGTAAQSGLPAGMLTVQAVGSSVEDTVDNMGNADSTASSTLHGISFAGGLITIGELTTSAEATSDGNQGQVSGSSSAVGMTIAGEPVSIDSSGIHVLGNSENLLGSLVPTVDQILATAGITITLTNPTDTISGASAERQLDGLAITINLSTFDKDLDQLLAELPSSITSVLDQLPVPTPYEQSFTFDLGWVNVEAAATPPFELSLGNLNSGSGGSSLLPTGTSPSAGGSTFTPGTTGTTSPTGSTTLPQVPSGTVVPAAPALFKGIGTGLIVLGAVLAALLVGLLMGTDSAVGRLAPTVPCVGEDVGDLG